MDNNYNLFNKMKQHKWDELKELLSDQNIDINVRDNHNNYLIHFAVLFNKKDIVSILINKGSKLDINDSEGRSILYNIIKYDYKELLELFLHFNFSSIGVPLTDMQDNNGNMPIHYAIKYRNLYMIKKLLAAGSNVTAPNHKGFNALHLSLYTKRVDIFKEIMSYPVAVNAKCDTGETALHIACNLQFYDAVDILIDNDANVNIGDNNEFTPLHYAATINSFKLAKTIVKAGGNPNAQDYYGNTPLHYAILEDNVQIATFLYPLTNLNFVNAEGKTPLHIAIEIETSNKEHYLKYLLDNSKLTIKDNEGFTPFHYLVYYDLWENYFDLLQTKKINIFAETKSGIRVLDLVSDKKLELLYNLAAISYLNHLKKKTGWEHKWQNICADSKKSLSPKEQDALKDIIKTGINSDKHSSCIAAITQYLKKLNLKKMQCIESIPRKNKLCSLKIPRIDRLSVCTFTGITLDIVCSLLYLALNFKNVCVPITENFVENSSLHDHYKSLGYNMKLMNEFMNFEIVWSNKKIFYPTYFTKMFKECIQSKKRFIVIPLGIESHNGHHANVLIYDTKIKEMERFEPNGSNPPFDFDYYPSILDSIIKRKLIDIDPKIKYVPPSEYIPKIGFQMYDIYEGNKSKIGDPGGFCALWTVWYTQLRVSHPDIPRKKLISKAIKRVKELNWSFRDTIRNFSRKPIQLRDSILTKVGIDINDWINDNYTSKQFQDTLNYIRQYIKKI